MGLTLPGCMPYLVVSDQEMRALIDRGEAVSWCVPNTYLVKDSICEYYFDWNRTKNRWEGIDFCETTKTRNR